MAWLGLACYTLQLYYDFSGYSDMAIGLGKMFGFHFDENFRWPYAARSFIDLWRRWHISLTSWFRDYVYIPLGGSRVGHAKQLRNLLIVWSLTGIWHGANWTFLCWGLFSFVLIVLEKYCRLGQGWPAPLPASVHYAGVYLFPGLFRADSLTAAGQYFAALFGANGAGRGAGGVLPAGKPGVFGRRGAVRRPLCPLAPGQGGKEPAGPGVVGGTVPGTACPVCGLFLLPH